MSITDFLEVERKCLSFVGKDVERFVYWKEFDMTEAECRNESQSRQRNDGNLMFLVVARSLWDSCGAFKPLTVGVLESGNPERRGRSPRNFILGIRLGIYQERTQKFG